MTLLVWLEKRKKDMVCYFSFHFFFSISFEILILYYSLNSSFFYYTSSSRPIDRLALY